MKIEKGIPIPSKKVASELTIILGKMECGDSVFIEEKLIDKARNAKNAYCSTSDKKFVTRRVDNGYRLWRVN